MGLQNCCCCSLKTGGLIIGWLGVISAISGLCVYVPSLAYLNQSSDELFHKLVAEHQLTEIQQVTHEQVVAGVRYITLNGIASSIVTLLVDGSLLYGTYKNNKMFLLPWLITTMIIIVLFGIFSILITLLTFLYGGATYGVVVLFILAIVFALYLYFWICIMSLYKKFGIMELRNRRGYDISSPAVILNHTPTAPYQNPPPYEYKALNV